MSLKDCSRLVVLVGSDVLSSCPWKGVAGKFNFQLLFKLHLCPQYSIFHFPFQQFRFAALFTSFPPHPSTDPATCGSQLLQFLWQQERRLWPRAIKYVGGPLVREEVGWEMGKTFAATMFPSHPLTHISICTATATAGIENKQLNVAQSRIVGIQSGHFQCETYITTAIMMI